MYGIRITAAHVLLTKKSVEYNREIYPPSTSAEVVIDAMVNNFLERWFVPWQRGKAKGFLLEFIASRSGSGSERCDRRDIRVQAADLRYDICGVCAYRR